MGRQPDGICAEVFEIVELLGDAFEITDAVAVAVRETARVDLIKNCGLPPFEI